MKQSNIIKQSVISTWWRGKLGIYETRILLKCIDHCQTILPQHITPTSYTPAADFDLSLYFQLGELTSSHNHDKARHAIINLMKLVVEHYDERSHTWTASPLFTEAQCETGSGAVKIKMRYWVASEIVDFKRGWVTYAPDQIIRIKRVTTARLYALTCAQTEVLTYRVETLRRILFGSYSNEYAAKPSDFCRKILITAAHELAALGLNGFEVALIKTDNRKTAPITHVKLTPVKREEKAEELRTIADFGRQEILIRNYLATQFNFRPAELRGNAATITQFSHLPDCLAKFQRIVERARRKRVGHGYIINSLKREINPSL